MAVHRRGSFATVAGLNRVLRDAAMLTRTDNARTGRRRDGGDPLGYDVPPEAGGLPAGGVPGDVGSPPAGGVDVSSGTGRRGGNSPSSRNRARAATVASSCSAV